jgi:AcrR family transcriptional regulator
VEDVKPPRDRRSRRATETRERIIEAAGRLFAERGYGATTIDAVATEADVAVETVYARFKNKRNLLSAYLDVAIAGDAEPVALLDRPEAQAVRQSTDPREQVRLMAPMARHIHERNATAHAVLRSAAPVEPDAAAILEEDERRRVATQRAFVELIAASGGLRDGLSIDEATDTLSVIACPETFATLTRRGWSADRYERWLADTIPLVLLNPG